MYGISVMSCVQTGYTGRRASSAAGIGMQQKCIRISRNDVSVRGESLSLKENGNEGRGGYVSGAASLRRRQPYRPVRGDAAGDGGTGNGCHTGSRRQSAHVVRTAVLALVFAGMLAGFRMMTRASSTEQEPVYKYYTAVTIGYGEDLSDLVFRYCDSSQYRTAEEYVREICSINSIPYQKGKLPDLSAGTTIVIPYFDTQLK